MQRREFLKDGRPGRRGIRDGRHCRVGRQAGPCRSAGPCIALFTDHLDDSGYSYAEVAKMIAPLKIAGPDLTVRGGGVVAAGARRRGAAEGGGGVSREGLSIPMISTEPDRRRRSHRAADPVDDGQARHPLLQARLLPLSRPGQVGSRSRSAAQGAGWPAGAEREAGVKAGLHNHAGATIGGAIWDAWELLRPLDPGARGLLFRPRPRHDRRGEARLEAEPAADLPPAGDGGDQGLRVGENGPRLADSLVSAWRGHGELGRVFPLAREDSVCRPALDPHRVRPRRLDARRSASTRTSPPPSATSSSCASISPAHSPHGGCGSAAGSDRGRGLHLRDERSHLLSHLVRRADAPAGRGRAAPTRSGSRPAAASTRPAAATSTSSSPRTPTAAARPGPNPGGRR